SSISRNYNLSWQECAKYVGISSYELFAGGYLDGIINYSPNEHHLLPNLRAAILSSIECIEKNAKVFLRTHEMFFDHYKESIKHYLDPSELLVEENRIADRSPTGILNVFGSVYRFMRYLKLRNRISSQSILNYSRLSHLKIPEGRLNERLAIERQEKFQKWVKTPLEIRYNENLNRSFQEYRDARDNRGKERGKIATFFMGDPKENFGQAVDKMTMEILVYLYNYWKEDASENLIQLHEYLKQIENRPVTHAYNILQILQDKDILLGFQNSFQNIILFDLLYDNVMESLSMIAGELKGTNQISQNSVAMLFERAFDLAMQAFEKQSLNYKSDVIRDSFFKWLVVFIRQKNCDQIMKTVSDWKRMVFPRLSPPLFALVSYYFSNLLPGLHRSQSENVPFDGRITPKNIGIRDFWNRLDRAYKDLLIFNLLREYKKTAIAPDTIIQEFFTDFKETYQDLMTSDPVRFPGFRKSIEKAIDSQIRPCGVITGMATYEDGNLQRKVGLVVSNSLFQAGAFDMASGEKVCKLLVDCAEQKLPVVMFISSGGMQTKEGPGSLFSMAVVNDRITRFVKDHDLPVICFGFRDCTGGSQASFVTHILVRTYYLSGSVMPFAGQLVVESHLQASAILSNYLSVRQGSMNGLVQNPFDQNIDERLHEIDPEIPKAELTVKKVISSILTGEYRPSAESHIDETLDEISEQLHVKKLENVLIHARGCTAARLIQGAHDSGLNVILVQSDADIESYPTRLLTANDRLVCIGGNTPQESYLNAMSVIRVAEQENAQSIHPGIGFLSENPAYAKICRTHGFNFIGPHAMTMHLMGNKTNAIETAKKLKVPVVPGSDGVLSDPVHAKAVAEDIGFPVLIKAAHGGGGKGIMVVEDPAQFIPLYSRMSQEALSAFGNGDLYLERYIRSMRHLEVQILRDTHGNSKILGVRDCSVQRKFQKIIEESASNVPDKILKQLYKYTNTLINGIDYIGAGTVEFIYDRKEKKVYFMEMNTRLQVEHPVSEMTSGIDLVHQQFRIASGESIKDLDVRQDGHSIEWRINAERVEKNTNGAIVFLPDPGYLSELFLPAEQHVRVITAVEKGSVVPPYYDSMIVQIVVWGKDRESAIKRLLGYLKRVQVHGISTNQALVQNILEDQVFASGDYDTHFLPEFLKRIDEHELIRQTIDYSGSASTSTEQESLALPGSNELKVISPRMGTFYRANSPEDPPFIKEGEVINRDKVMCLMESMKVFSELTLQMYKGLDGESLYHGFDQFTVKKIMADNGQTVSRGDLLFVIEPVTA
ncbi:MAG: ATP-grasp domain-containing protein, partial [SAR324 cluster bacterium]|nr:ATP-grasp domain-containing protein [SAR324 cluster bacterium]